MSILDLSQFICGFEQDRRLYAPLQFTWCGTCDFGQRFRTIYPGFVLWHTGRFFSDASRPPKPYSSPKPLVGWSSQVFGEKTDREQAVLILQGIDNAHTDNGVYLIHQRLKTRAFATADSWWTTIQIFLLRVAQASY